MGSGLMIVGNGQLANIFKAKTVKSDVCIFASGVSDSNCIDANQFKREENLLRKSLKENSKNKFVYFSSCALSANNYIKNEYYKHKENMESIIKTNSNDYFVFRIPQLFGELKHHTTLINFIYESILAEKMFYVYKDAYRYVIEINDVKTLVEHYLEDSKSCITVDLANPYRYKVIEIVHVLEKLLDKKAIYSLIEKEDKYKLDLTPMKSFVQEHHIDIAFGKEYLYEKLQEKI